MITLSDYWMGRDASHPLEMAPHIEASAIRLLAAVNMLLSKYGAHPKVTSGWRPPSINAKTPGAAKFSRHMTGQAIDLDDPFGELDEWLIEVPGFDHLKTCGLWMEHPAATKGWCHLQSVPPRSGNRVFYP